MKSGTSIEPARHCCPIFGSAIFAIAGLIIARAGWFDDEPYFGWAGDQTFTCYQDRAQRHPTLSIAFSEGGRHAVVRFPDRHVTTTFQRGGLAGDVYRGDGIELILDPEAYVTDYGDQRIGPCQHD